jgi:hypothetical protein
MCIDCNRDKNSGSCSSEVCYENEVLQYDEPNKNQQLCTFDEACNRTV